MKREEVDKLIRPIVFDSWIKQFEEYIPTATSFEYETRWNRWGDVAWIIVSFFKGEEKLGEVSLGFNKPEGLKENVRYTIE